MNMLLVGNQKEYIYIYILHIYIYIQIYITYIYIYIFKLLALHGASLPNVKYFRNKIGKQFNSTPLVIEQRFRSLAKHPFRNVALKNGLYRQTKIVKYNDKENYVCSGYRIAFDGKDSWNFLITFQEMLHYFELIIAHHLTLTILKVIFYFQVKQILFELMAALVQQKLILQ